MLCIYVYTCLYIKTFQHGLVHEAHDAEALRGGRDRRGLAVSKSNSNSNSNSIGIVIVIVIVIVKV